MRAPRELTWAVGATDNPMGQQHYETEIQRAIEGLQDARGWEFIRLRLAPLQATTTGEQQRFPARLLRRGGEHTARAVGAVTYRRASFVHRFDLRLPPAGSREVVTAHDLPPLRFDDEGGLPAWVGAATRRAFGVITPSAFAEREVRELLGVTRTWVIPYGLSGPYLRPQRALDSELAALGITGRFVLHAAGASARKNLPALAQAWRHIQPRTDATLVLAGPPDTRRDRHFAGMPGTIMIGRQAPELIARLMVSSSAVVVPSLYEGFGLPALEGMACGTPVVAAACGALPEVCGDAALLVDPGAEGLAEGLLAVLTSTEVHGRLRDAGPSQAATFSWELAAARHLEVYDELLAARHPFTSAG